MRRRLPLAGAVCLFLFPALAGAQNFDPERPGMRGPWSVSQSVPVVSDAHAGSKKSSARRTATSNSRPVLLAMRFYSSVISDADGARCQMYPTCAMYAVQAVRKHGPVLGGVLAADRLLHEGGVQPGWFEMVRHHGRSRWHDPVERNDFWLPSQRKKKK